MGKMKQRPKTVEIKVRAPARIDFAGGWTDTKPFSTDHGGAVVNAAINQYVRGKLVKEISGKHIESKQEYMTSMPHASGLGGSSSFNVLRTVLLSELTEVKNDKQRKEIAEKTYLMESQIVGIICGKQDQYAAAFGGINFMTFNKRVKVERLDLDPEVLYLLQKKLVLCYTGKSRLSSNLHEQVWGNYRNENNKIVKPALFRLKQIAIEMREKLLNGELDDFGALLTDNWENQKKLADCITNEQIEEIFKTAFDNGAIGGKACGAGGGGCLVFYTHTPDKLKSILSTIEEVEIIDFKFDFDGLTIETTYS